MWTKSYSVITQEITKEQIWQLFTDIDNWNRWKTSIEYSKLLGELKEGSFFILKPKKAPKVKIEIVELEPFRKFTDLTRFPLAKMYGEHLYEETPDGLKITITMSVKGLLSKLWIKLVANDVVKNLPKDIENQIKHAKNL